MSYTRFDGSRFEEGSVEEVSLPPCKVEVLGVGHYKLTAAPDCILKEYGVLEFRPVPIFCPYAMSNMMHRHSDGKFFATNIETGATVELVPKESL